MLPVLITEGSWTEAFWKATGNDAGCAAALKVSMDEANTAAVPHCEKELVTFVSTGIVMCRKLARRNTSVQ